MIHPVVERLQRMGSTPSVRRLRKAVAHRSPFPAGRRYGPRRNQTMLVSYPRSGNTWTRYLLTAAILADRDHDPGLLRFEQVGAMVPDIDTTPYKALRFDPAVTVIKSHLPFTHSYHRVVQLTRHPVDVAASFLRYHDLTGYRTETDRESDFVDAFLAGRLQYLGTWADHTGSWLGARGHDARHLHVRYEDLRADPVGWLHRIWHHCYDRELDEAAAEIAVRAASLDQMRESELTSFRPQDRGVAGGPTFIGTAETGGIGRGLSDESIATLYAALGPTLRRYDYPDRPPAAQPDNAADVTSADA